MTFNIIRIDASRGQYQLDVVGDDTLYRQAIQTRNGLTAGTREECEAILERLQEMFPDHPAIQQLHVSADSNLRARYPEADIVDAPRT